MPLSDEIRQAVIITLQEEGEEAMRLTGDLTKMLVRITQQQERLAWKLARAKLAPGDPPKCDCRLCRRSKAIRQAQDARDFAALIVILNEMWAELEAAEMELEYRRTDRPSCAVEDDQTQTKG